MRRPGVLVACLALPLLGGCWSSSEPETVSLDRTYSLVDDQGRVAGKVTFTPLGGGQVTDNAGNVIGQIVNP